jgi:outer membrane protein assembly factor BamB
MIMKRNVFLVCLMLIFVGSAVFVQAQENWPQWRGPDANGVCPNGNPPIEWNETKNVKWKIEIPGKGHATPVTWRDQVFILTTIETDKQVKMQEENDQQQGSRSGMLSVGTNKIHKFVVFSINRHNGKVLWQRTVTEEYPQDKTHDFGSWASNSPVTDGKNVFAYFGSRGLFCLDMQGNVIWERDFGQMEKVRSFGEGSSPVLYNDKILVNWDHEGDSFIIALDKNTGKDTWKVDRDEISSWATPLIIQHNGAAQVITNATNKVRSYDPNTGKLIWECSGMTRNVIPTPVFANGMVYVLSGFRGAALFAIDLAKAKGDITGSDAIIWQYNQDTPYTPSPVLYNNLLYMLRGNNGDLTCLDATNGKVHYSTEKLEGMGNVFASLVAAQDRIYVTGKNGTFYVIKAGSKFEILAKNELDDNFEASPAIIGNNLYLRGYKNLYCIAQE